jgi:hypothetical protein
MSLPASVNSMLAMSGQLTQFSDRPTPATMADSSGVKH